MAEINGYELSRKWFDWCFENPEKVTPNHTAMYFFAIEHCNRLGWKEKFGFPMDMAKNAIGIKNFRTYSKTFEDLVEWGFFKIHQRSKNQWSANIIALVKNTIATTKALDKAMQKHNQKQRSDSVCIDKQIHNNTVNNTETKKQYTPPTLELVRLYFIENGYSETSANKAYEYYNSANWHDSNGKQVKNWKQKMQGVWFKDENKTASLQYIDFRSGN